MRKDVLLNIQRDIWSVNHLYVVNAGNRMDKKDILKNISVDIVV